MSGTMVSSSEPLGPSPGGPLLEGGGLRPWAWATLLVYAGSLLIFQLGSARTFSAHESFMAQAAREMLATGDFLVPRIGGKPWLEKPIMPYWVVAGVGGATGEVSEYTARLPSALAGIIGTLILAGMVARWFGPTTGLITGLIQATTVYLVTYARLAEMDIYLWVLVLGCLAIFARRHVAGPLASTWTARPEHGGEGRGSTCDRWLFFALLGLTQLCKGPLFGAAMVLIPCGLIALWQRDWRIVRWVLFWPGILLAGVIAMAWPAAIMWHYPEAADIWWVHTFGRLGQEGCINPEPPWYYLTTIPWQILPWTPAVLGGVAASWRRARRYGSAADRFLWVWFVGPVLVLSAISAKHHHYIIYALPPCSVWAAEGLIRARALITHVLRHASWRWGLLAGLMVVLIGLGFWIKSKYPEHLLEAAGLAGLYVLGTALAAATCAWRNYRTAAIVLFASLWAMFAFVHHRVVGRFDSYAADTQLLQRAADYGEGPVLVYGVYPMTEQAEAPRPGAENFDRINPARVLLYLPATAELYFDLSQLEERGRRVPGAVVVSTVGFEGDLRKAGELERIDQTSRPRSKRWGEYSHMAVYRVKWRSREMPGTIPVSAPGQVP